MPRQSSARKTTWRAFLRDLFVTFIGTFAAFALAVWWDLSQRRSIQREEVAAATNIFYSQVETNYGRLRRAGPVLRTEMRLLQEGNLSLAHDVSPLVELQETSDELLVRMAPSVGSVQQMNRVLTVAREAKVINSQIRWRESLRARRIATEREKLALFRTDSVLFEGMRFLMGVVESPDTLYKGIRIRRLK